MVQIMIPPLRHRLSDIPALGSHLVKKISREFGCTVSGISKPAQEVLMQHTWPGNVRELENALGRAIINMLPEETVIEDYHLRFLEVLKANQESAAGLSKKSYSEAFDEWEKIFLTRIMSECGGNKAEAAKRLQISIRNLYYKLKKARV